MGYGCDLADGCGMAGKEPGHEDRQDKVAKHLHFSIIVGMGGRRKRKGDVGAVSAIGFHPA